MTDHILDALTLRRDDLARKLKARRGTPGYEQNVVEIEQAIGQLDAEIQQRQSAPEGDPQPNS